MHVCIQMLHLYSSKACGHTDCKLLHAVLRHHEQVWRGRLHVPGMFRAGVAINTVAGTGDIARMVTSSEVRP